jgi:hypothetical protein
MELSSSWVGVHSLAKEFVEFKLVSEERSRSLKKLTSDDYNSLTTQDLFSNL